MSVKHNEYGYLVNDEGRRICDICQREDHFVCIHDAATGRKTMWCYECHPNTTDAVAKVAKKLHEHETAGTLDEYSLEQRLVDLRGDNK